jgi:AraC-like DNA-binding protein
MDIEFKDNFFNYGELDRKYRGLMVPLFGHEKTAPGHEVLTVRDHYLLHFITGGHGYFIADGKTYTLRAGNGFIIEPNKRSAYRADETDPWEYYWIAFRGTDAPLFMDTLNFPNRHYFSFNDTVLDPLKNLITELRERPLLNPDYVALKVNSVFLEIVARFVKNNSPHSKVSPQKSSAVIDAALLYFEKHYAEDINVASVAGALNVSRTYFTTLFKNTAGINPKDYLTTVRIQKAKALFKQNPGILVVEAGSLCGIPDPALFIHTFKRETGMTPGAFIKSLGEYRHSDTDTV